MNGIKFSIITITFNSSATVERTIKSVLMQTYKNYEYIIIDGASNDSTMDIIRQYEPQFKGKMKWISEPDDGIYNAMNKGIEFSSGEIIGIVNSDDWLEPTALESVFKFSSLLEDFDKVIICGSLRFYYNNGTSQIMTSNKERFYKGIKNHSFGYGAYHPSMFVGKGVYKMVGLFDEHFYIAADIDFVYRCYQLGIQFYFIDNVLNNMSDGGVSNAMALKKILADTYYDAQKRNIPRYKAIWTLFILCSKQFIKRVIPDKWISVYRHKKGIKL